MKTKLLNAVWLAFVCLLAACSGESDYVRVIPKEAAVVTAVNLQQLVEKSGITANDGKILMTEIQRSVGNEISNEAGALLDEIVQNPSQCGLDLKEKVYLFALPEMKCMGMLAAMDNEGKVKEFINKLASEQLCQQVMVGEGYSSAIIADKTVVVYDASAFLLVSGAEEQAEELTQQAVKWLGTSQEQSYMGTEEFAKLAATKGDVAVAVSLACIPKKQLNLMDFKFPKNVNLEDVSAIAALYFEKGELRLDVENIYRNEELKEVMEIQEKIYSGELEGKFSHRFPSNIWAYLSLPIQGKAALQMLKENEEIRDGLKIDSWPLEVETIINSIEGELSLGLAGIGRVPQLGLFAEVANEDALAAMNRYKALLGMLRIDYGIKDGVFYLSNFPEKLDGNLEDSSWSRELKGKNGYFVINFKQINETIKSLGLIDKHAEQSARMVQYLDEFRFYHVGFSEAHLILTTSDRKSNVLKQVMEAIRENQE